MSKIPPNKWEEKKDRPEKEKDTRINNFMNHTAGFTVTLILLTLGITAIIESHSITIPLISERESITTKTFFFVITGITLISSSLTVGCWTIASCWYYIQTNNSQKESR